MICFFFIPALVIRFKRKLFTTHTWSQATRCNSIWRSRCPLFWARQPTMRAIQQQAQNSWCMYCAASLDRMKPTPLVIFTFVLSWVQHSFACSYPYLPTRVPSHFIYSQNTNTISLHLFNHLSTLTSLKQCPYIPLPNLHTRFGDSNFIGGLCVIFCFAHCSNQVLAFLYPCFPVGRSGNSNFGFCNEFLFPGAGYRAAGQPPTWRTKGCSSSGLSTLWPIRNG